MHYRIGNFLPESLMARVSYCAPHLSTTHCLSSPTSTRPHRPLRYAVLGAGFAGLSVVWHLLQRSPKDLHLRVDIYDEVGIGGGASGVSGGLLHPYSPKAKLLWKGEDCWKECMKLLRIAESEFCPNESNPEVVESSRQFNSYIVRRRGILRPAMSMKNLNVLNDNAQNYFAGCRIEIADKDASHKLVPNLHIPFNSAFYMPDAVNVHPQNYLQALFIACQNSVKEMSDSGTGVKELFLHKQSMRELREFEGEYDAVIICLGAKADLLSELSGRLPLRTCRGVITHLQLPNNRGEVYPDHGPSILSDAWLAIQGPRNLYMGSTWNWKSRDSSPIVSKDEVTSALEELIPKVSVIYPSIKNWTLCGAKAGLRAMPPLTPLGSLPIMGCVNDIIGSTCNCKYWLVGGLGSRGLLYHGLLGKLMAEAVVACNENLIPSEFTSWKMINR